MTKPIEPRSGGGIGGWGVPTPARRRCRETPGGCRENTESAETPGKPGAQSCYANDITKADVPPRHAAIKKG